MWCSRSALTANIKFPPFSTSQEPSPLTFNAETKCFLSPAGPLTLLLFDSEFDLQRSLESGFNRLTDDTAKRTVDFNEVKEETGSWAKVGRAAGTGVGTIHLVLCERGPGIAADDPLGIGPFLQ